MKTGILYFTTCFHGFGILRHVDPFVRMLHIWARMIIVMLGVMWADMIVKSCDDNELSHNSLS